MGDPGEPRDRRPPGAIDIPDLELPPPRTLSQSGLRAVRVEPSTPPVRISTAPLEAPFDDDEIAAHGPSLDLDLHSPISSGHVLAHRSEGFSADDFDLEPAAPHLDPSAGVGLDLGAPWPSGVTPDRSRIVVDRNAARELAAFGAAPGLLLTPVYALRVARRRRALKTSLRDVERATEQASARRDALLAELAERLRPAIERSGALRALLAPLAELGRSAAERGSAVASRAAELSTDLAEHDRRIADQRREHEADSAAAAETGRGFEAAERARVRAEARLKRLRIEMRGIEQQAIARGARAGDPLEPDLAAQMLPLRQKEPELAAELDAAERAEAAARSVHGDVAERASAKQRLLAGMERERAERAVLGRRALESDSRALGEAERARGAALADVGRAVLKARGDVPVDAPTLAAVRAADEAVAALVEKSELHLAALDTCDADKVQTGWIVLSLAGLAGLALGAWQLFS